MANAFLLYDDAIVSASLSQSSAAADDLGNSLDADNLAFFELSSKLRHTGCSAEWMQAVLSADTGIDTICLLGHNASLAAVFDLTLYSDAAATEVVYSATDLSIWPRVFGIGEATMAEMTAGGIPIATDLDEYPRFRLVKLDQSYTVRAIRIDWRDPDNPDGYLEAGRLLAGVKWSPGYNITFGTVTEIESDDEIHELGGGAVWFARGDAWRVISVRWEDLAKSEAEGFMADFMRRSRGSRPFLFVGDPDDGLGEWRSCLYAIIEGRQRPRLVRRDPENHAVAITLREIVA